MHVQVEFYDSVLGFAYNTQGVIGVIETHMSSLYMKTRAAQCIFIVWSTSWCHYLIKLKFVLDNKVKKSILITHLMHGKPVGLRISVVINYGMLCNI